MNKKGNFLLEFLITMAIITAILPPLTAMLKSQIDYFHKLKKWDYELRTIESNLIKSRHSNE